MDPHTIQILLTRLDQLGFGPWHDDFIASMLDDPPRNTEGFVRRIMDAEGMGDDADLHLTRQVRNLVAELVQGATSGITQDQKNLLDQRSARVAEGAAQILDWDGVKHSIGKA